MWLKCKVWKSANSHYTKKSKSYPKGNSKTNEIGTSSNNDQMCIIESIKPESYER